MVTNGSRRPLGWRRGRRADSGLGARCRDFGYPDAGSLRLPGHRGGGLRSSAVRAARWSTNSPGFAVGQARGGRGLAEATGRQGEEGQGNDGTDSPVQIPSIRPIGLPKSASVGGVVRDLVGVAPRAADQPLVSVRTGGRSGLGTGRREVVGVGDDPADRRARWIERSQPQCVGQMRSGPWLR